MLFTKTILTLLFNVAMMKCTFCSFVKGERKNSYNGYPFLPLHVTKNTISFLSIDFPASVDGHILVIPTKHAVSITDLSLQCRHELMDHVVRVVTTLKKNHDGCNVLLNEGKIAGQYVGHVHFHIIPRNKMDGITVEKWKTKNMTLEKYVSLSEKLKKVIGYE